MTWLTITLDTTTLHLENSISGVELFIDHPYSEFRLYPLIILICGLVIIINSTLRTVSNNQSNDYISCITFTIVMITSLLFIADAPLEEELHIGFEGKRSIVEGLGPQISLILSIVCTMISIVPIIIGNVSDMESFGMSRKVKRTFINAGFEINNDDIVLGTRRYGHVYESYTRLYDLDLTFDAVPHRNICSIALNNGTLSVITNCNSEPTNTNTTLICRGRE